MTNTLTISVSPQDLKDLETNPSWSASKIFRSAMKLQRRMDGFMEVYCLEDYIEMILRMQSRFVVMNQEIMKREEKIDSLKNVLEEKIVAERRLRETKQGNPGSGQESGIVEELRREIGEQPDELAWSSKPKN